MSNKYEADPLPWNDSTKWKYNQWYPMPVGAMWIDDTNYYFDGYSIFEKDNDMGDIKRAHDGTYTLKTAIAICEEHNGQEFEGIPR